MGKIAINLLKEYIKEHGLRIFFLVLLSSFIYLRAIILPIEITKLTTYQYKDFFIFLSLILLYYLLYFVYFKIKRFVKRDIKDFYYKKLLTNLVKKNEVDINDNIDPSTYINIMDFITFSCEFAEMLTFVWLEIISFIIIAFILCKSNPSFIFLFIIFITILFFTVKNSIKKIKHYSKETNNKRDLMINYNEDIQRNLVNIFNFNRKNQETKNISNNVDLYSEIFTHNISLTTKYFIINMSLFYIFFGLIIVILFYKLKMNLISFNKFIQLFAIIVTFLLMSAEPISSIILDMITGYGYFLNAYLKIRHLFENSEEKEKRNLENYSDKLTIYNLNFRYDDKYIYKNFSFQFDENKMTTIIGSIGSGKSTLLKVIFGYFTFDSGDIFYKNKSIKFNIEEWRNNIYYGSQFPNLFNKNIKENILYGTDHHKLDVIKNLNIPKIDELLNRKDKIGLEGKKLSGGEKQIISLVRFIINPKKIILLDEPTSSLDVASKKIILRLIKVLKKKSTIICVSHDKELIKLSDNIVNLNKLNLCKESL